MLILILFAFIGGIVTIVSPCVLPILPIVLSGSVGGGKRRPWGIITGFVLGFTFFTLFLTAIVSVFHISPDVLRTISVIVIGLFGLSLIVPNMQAIVERGFSRLANRIPQANGDGYGSGVLIGLSLGLIWTPCVGPILASVIALALTQQVTSAAVVITLAYSLGTAIPMFAIMYGGRNLLTRVPSLMRNTGRIQQVFGVIMIITAIGIFFNVDRSFQTYILNTFPQYGTGLTALEDNAAVRNALQGGMGTTTGTPAPELIPGGQWFNTQPLTLESLKGQKVVLLDFMTYSCINCIRTFPYLKDWWTKYESDGLVIIGIHTPEFEFEKNPDNVAKALKDFGLTFPVMQDNNYDTWRAYQNSYWPRKYLIDIHGNIVFDHIGEGGDAETEAHIVAALKERATVLGLNTTIGGSVTTTDEAPVSPGSPETYFGAGRNEYLGNGRQSATGEQQLAAPSSPKLNTLYLDGTWNFSDESARNVTAGAKIVYHYYAKNVFLVAGAQQNVRMQVLLDGKPIGNKAGKDVAADGTITINDQRLYHIVGDSQNGDHTVELILLDPNADVFTFTFG